MGNIHKKPVKLPRLEPKVAKPNAKVILLGQGRSGRSTIARQLQRKFGKKEDQYRSWEDSGFWRTLVFRNIIESMVDLVKAHERHATFSDPTLREARDYLMANYGSPYSRSQDAYSVMNDDIKNALVVLWKDEGFRETFEGSGTSGAYYVIKNLDYYMNDAERILKADVELNDLDRLCARVRTTGIVEIKFDINDVNFTFLDFGGARNERRKWLHVFEGLTTVVFVSAISEYDEVLFEDASQNSLEESMILFDRTFNHQAFVERNADAVTIVYLNKSDLFQRKLARVPIKYVDPSDPKLNRWEEFNGPNAVGLDVGSADFAEAYEAASEYFANKFKAMNKTPTDREVVVHVTCALEDTFTDGLVRQCQEIALNNFRRDQALIDDNP